MTEATLTWISGLSPLSKGKCTDEGMGPPVPLPSKGGKPLSSWGGGGGGGGNGEQSEAQGLFLQ